MLATAPQVLARPIGPLDRDWSTGRRSDAWLAAVRETASAAVEACRSPEAESDEDF